MEYTTEFNETDGICTVRVTGIHKRPDDSVILQQFARDFGDERGCQRFLFDMTQADIVGGTTNTYLVGTVPVDPDRRQTRQKISLVYSGSITIHKFMETVAVNRGYQLRVFDRMDNAVEWLKLKKDNA